MGIQLLRTSLRILSLFLLFAIGRISAVEVEKLYQVKVAVVDQSNKSRWSAALKGFKEVLVRRSGNQQVLNAFEVQQAFAKVTAYLQRFEYSSKTAEDAQSAFELLLDFEPRLIDQLIQESGMPIWGSNRPVTLFWLAVEQDFKRQLIKEELQTSELSQLLAVNAARRGLPVILPLMDLEDQLVITLSDVWGHFQSPILQASERYGADAVIAGRIRQLGQGWQAQLTYFNEGKTSRFEVNQDSLELLIASVTNKLADSLCEKYCVVEIAERNQVIMQVSNIRNFASFKSAQNYLMGLSSIRKVNVSKIAGVQVQFNLGLLGDLQAVKEGIGLGNKLIEIPPPLEDPFKPQSGDSENLQTSQSSGAQDEPEFQSLAEFKTGDTGETGVSEDEETNPEETNPEETMREGPMREHNAQTDSAPEILYYRWVE